MPIPLGNYIGLQFDRGLAIDSNRDGKFKNHVYRMTESVLAPLLYRCMAKDA